MLIPDNWFITTRYITTTVLHIIRGKSANRPPPLRGSTASVGHGGKKLILMGGRSLWSVLFGTMSTELTIKKSNLKITYNYLIDGDDECLDDLGWPLTWPEMSRLRIYATRTKTSPWHRYPEPTILGGLSHDRTGSLADLRKSTRTHAPSTVSEKDVLGGLSYDVRTGEFSGLCALRPKTNQRPNKTRDRFILKFFLFLNHNAKETCKNNNRNDNNKTKTNVKKIYSENTEFVMQR